MDILALQNQISTLDDNILSRALSTDSDQVPHLMLMMEMARRSRIRSGPDYPPRPANMMQEMQAGMYMPVPTPTFKWPELPGTNNTQMPGQSITQQPQNLQLDQPAGIGSLFSQNR